MSSRIWQVPMAAATVALLQIGPSLAEDTQRYILDVTKQSETGVIGHEIGGFFTGYSDCYRALKKLEIGRVTPRGLSISPDGKSYAWTTVSGRCKRDTWN